MPINLFDVFESGYFEGEPVRERVRESDPQIDGRRNPHRYVSEEKFGHWTLIEPFVAAHSIFDNPIVKGFWKVVCDCGTLGLVHTSDLHQQTQRGFSCGCLRRPRKPLTRTRPPADHAGQIVGRLHVIQWQTNRGWECVCLTCGGIEIVRNSSLLPREGMRACKASETVHAPAPDSRHLPTSASILSRSESGKPI